MSAKLTRRAFLGGTGLAALSLAACGGSSGDAGSGESTASGSVYWLNFKPELDTALQDIAKTYTDSTKVPVKVVTAASGTYDQQLTAEMDKTDAPTVFVIDGSPDSVKDWESYAIDLTDSKLAQEANTENYFHYGTDDKLVAIGYCFECYGIISNPDLLEKAGYDIATINNFDTLKACAEDIHQRAGELGFDAFAPADMDESNSWIYVGHMTNLPLFYESREAGGWTEAPATITGQFLPNYKNLYDLIINNGPVPPTQLATGGHDPMQMFKDQKVAFALNGSWEWVNVSESVPSAKMIPYYGGVPGEEKAGLNSGGGNSWVINNKMSQEDQDATMDFLVYCVSDKDASAKLSAELGDLPFINAAPGTNGFISDAEEYNAADCYNMDTVDSLTPNVDKFRAGLVSALNAYDNDQSEANWQNFVTAFVQGWAKNYQEVNG